MPTGGCRSEESTIQSWHETCCYIGMNNDNDFRDINFGILIIIMWIVETIATGIYIESL